MLAGPFKGSILIRIRCVLQGLVVLFCVGLAELHYSDWKGECEPEPLSP